MDKDLRCPMCYASIPGDSRFCKSCGRRVRRCPKCAALLGEGVMFCSACDTHLSQDHADAEAVLRQEDGEPPYLQWDGAPFSPLQRTTQTRQQWQLMVIAVMSMVIIQFAMVLLTVGPDLPEEDRMCLIDILAVTIVALVIGFWIRFWAGRRGAGHYDHGKWR